MWAIIGGSGFERFAEVTPIEDLNRETPFGLASSGLKKVALNQHQLFFLPRHGAHHELTPSEINYRANIFALKRLGVTKILSISAVGSLRENMHPGELVVPTQYINRTFLPRQHTFCGDGIVGHISLAKPVSEELVGFVDQLRHELNFPTHIGHTYVCIEGPFFSMQAESHWYRQMGADIIGMTNFPEFALAREAGMHYLPCCFVTDYDSWNQDVPHVTLEEVINIMKNNNQKALQLAKLLLDKSNNKPEQGCEQLGLATGLMSDPTVLSANQKEWLSILVGKKL